MNVTRKRGVILVLTLFALAFMSVLVVAYLDALATDLQILQNHLVPMKALYVAEAGVADAMNELAQDHQWNAGWPAGKTFPAGSSYEYVVEVDNQYPQVTITSTGVVAGFQKKIEVRVRVAGPPQSTPYPRTISSWKEL